MSPGKSGTMAESGRLGIGGRRGTIPPLQVRAKGGFVAEQGEERELASETSLRGRLDLGTKSLQSGGGSALDPHLIPEGTDEAHGTPTGLQCLGGQARTLMATI